MNGAFGRLAPADDLAAGVDSPGHANEAAEGAEVDHPAPRRPRKRTASVGYAGADDLAGVVDRYGKAGAARGAGGGAEVDHPARRRPQERMETVGGGGEGGAAAVGAG